MCLQPPPFYSSKSGEHLFVPSETVYAGVAAAGDAPPQKIVFEPRVAAPNPKDLQHNNSNISGGEVPCFDGSEYEKLTFRPVTNQLVLPHS